MTVTGRAGNVDGMESLGGKEHGAEPVVVTLMSRNLYLGADTALVLGSVLNGPEDLEARAREVLRQLQANDFSERGHALVDEIQDAEPHVVAMQEVVEVRCRTHETDTVIDFLTILQGLLDSRGLPYSFLPAQRTTTVDLGLGNGDRLTFTDRLALLARRDVEVLRTEGGRYRAVQPAPVGITLERGWLSMDCSISGTPHRITNTHLEVQAFPACQANQVEELLERVLPDRSMSTFLMGDFNSNAEGHDGDSTWTPAYDTVGAAGFRDLWIEGREGGESNGSTVEDGYTCCHESDLSLPGGGFDQRIDFIFHRGPGPTEVREVRRVGVDPSSRTKSRGLWPSDHAGVISSVAVPFRVP